MAAATGQGLNKELYGENILKSFSEIIEPIESKLNSCQSEIHDDLHHRVKF